MRELPILFSAPMVRAILEGRKTVTRRIVSPAPYRQEIAGSFGGGLLCFPDRKRPDVALIWPNAKAEIIAQCPYGAPGDVLWVKETFFAWGEWTVAYDKAKGRDVRSFVDRTVETGRNYGYAADSAADHAHPREAGRLLWWKRPAIFMPRAACRITLERTATALGRAQAPTPEEIVAEGIRGDAMSREGRDQLRDAWRDLWTRINGAHAWADNPWVWVVEFKRIEEAAKP